MQNSPGGHITRQVVMSVLILTIAQAGANQLKDYAKGQAKLTKALVQDLPKLLKKVALDYFFAILTLIQFGDHPVLPKMLSMLSLEEFSATRAVKVRFPKVLHLTAFRVSKKSSMKHPRFSRRHKILVWYSATLSTHHPRIRRT